MKKSYKIIIAVAVVALLAVAAWLIFGKEKKEQVSFSTAKVQKADIQNSITATGTIEPVTSVTVGTQVSGIVAHLYVDYNSEVRKGQVIAELDKTNLISELNTAKANLTSAQSSLNYQQANYKRYQTLYSKGLVSADDFESARLTYQQAQQQVNTSRENVKRAQTNLGYATITSPIDGIVLSKSVEEGQTVAASFSTPELFTIAQDLTNMQVIANIDEADIGEVKQGQRVTFTVDAFPDDIFQGSIKQVRQQATTTSNVVTYEVVISAPNGDLKLKPGLTANVTIFTMERNNVLAVPSKALRFTPNPVFLAKEESIQDCDGQKKVWTKEGNVFKAYRVETGTTNGTLTEILSGVKEGMEVLTDFSLSSDNAEGQQDEQASNPFMPKRPNNRNSKSGNGNAQGGGNQKK
ncbi:MAG: efflux RND transporter periplasmic adaptor subunit [Prevotella sp.]|nr:efflux RND transporter periplasmic adaptor subunit [Prevotella sp.]